MLNLLVDLGNLVQREALCIMRQKGGFRNLRYLLFALVLSFAIAAGSCGRVSGNGSDKDGKKSKFRITGVVSMLTDFLLGPTAYASTLPAAEAEPTTTAAVTKTDGLCPNDFEPKDDGKLYAYLYRITEDEVDFDYSDGASAEPACVVPVGEDGTYAFEFGENPGYEAAYILVRRAFSSSSSEMSVYKKTGSAVGNTLLFREASDLGDARLLSAISPRVVLANAGDTTMLAYRSTDNSISSESFSREAFLSGVTDSGLQAEGEVKLDINPLSSTRVGFNTLAYKMNGVAPTFAKDMKSMSTKELLAGLLADEKVSSTVIDAISSGALKLLDLTGSPEQALKALHGNTTTSQAILGHRARLLKSPIQTAVTLLESRNVDAASRLKTYTDEFASTAASGAKGTHVSWSLAALADVYTAASNLGKDDLLAKVETVLSSAVEKISSWVSDKAGLATSAAEKDVQRLSTVAALYLGNGSLKLKDEVAQERISNLVSDIAKTAETVAGRIQTREAEVYEQLSLLAGRVKEAYGGNDIAALEALLKETGRYDLSAFTVKLRDTILSAQSRIKSLIDQLRSVAREPGEDSPNEVGDLPGSPAISIVPSLPPEEVIGI